MGVLIVELFGFYSALKVVSTLIAYRDAYLELLNFNAQELAPAVRLYSIASLIAALAVMAAEMLRIVIHFKFKVCSLRTSIFEKWTDDSLHSERHHQLLHQFGNIYKFRLRE